MQIGHFGKYHNHNTLCLQFLLGLTIVPRENKNNAYVKRRVLWYFSKWPIRVKLIVTLFMLICIKCYESLLFLDEGFSHEP